MLDPQKAVQTLLDELVATGEENGLQAAVYHRGEPIVDAWAGAADPTRTPVTPDTLFTVYSVGKGITATALHILAERGSISYDDPIAKHWSEFAQNGKANILVRHAMAHLSGIPQMPPGVMPDDVLDWPGMCDRIAGLTPLWRPGETLCYHAMTYGWIVGGAAERADGRPFAKIVTDEIAGPLGLNGLFFGVPSSELHRVALLEPGAVEGDAVEPVIPGVVPDGSASLDQMNRTEIRQAVLPAYGMCVNARSLAKIYASLVGMGVDGVRLLSPDRVRQATAPQVIAKEANGAGELRFGLGYRLGGGPDGAICSRITAFGHDGAGGANGYADPEHDFAFGFTKNRFAANKPGHNTSNRIARVVRASLGIPE